MLFLISLRNGHPHHLFLPLSYFIHSMPSPPEDRLVNLSSTFPICIFIITTTNLDDECNPKLFDRPKSLSGLFQSMIMLLFFNVLFLSFLNAVSDSPCGFALEEWPYWSPKLGKWATVQLALHQFYEFSMLTQFAADFDHALQSVWHSHQKFFPPIKLVVSFHCIYLMSLVKLIPVWIDSEPNSFQWNSKLAYRVAM